MNGWPIALALAFIWALAILAALGIIAIFVGALL